MPRTPNPTYEMGSISCWVGPSVTTSQKQRARECGLLVFLSPISCTDVPYRRGRESGTITVNKFRDNLREQIEKVLSELEPLKVTRRNGGDFVVVGLEDRDRDQRTLLIRAFAWFQSVAPAATPHGSTSTHPPVSHFARIPYSASPVYRQNSPVP